MPRGFRGVRRAVSVSARQRDRSGNLSLDGARAAARRVQSHVAERHLGLWLRDTRGARTLTLANAPSSQRGFQVASGQRPFHAISDEPKVIIALHEGQTPPRPPRVPDALWDLSRTCCARTTRQRPTAEDVIARLRAVSAVPSVSTAAHSAPAVSRTLRRASAIRIPRPQWDTSPELNPTAESPSKIRKPGRFEGWVDLCA